MTHARVAGKINHWDSLQAERPRGQQMKSTVPGKIVNASGRFEEDNRRVRGSWRVASYELCDSGNLEVVEPADKSAFDALGIKVFYARSHYQITWIT
jgi:hypothetical protein